MKRLFYQIIIGVLILITLTYPAFSQEQNDPAVSLFDDFVILRFSLQLPVFIVVVKPDDEAGVDEQTREDAHLTYMPNLRLSGGFGISYKGFSVSYVRRIANISDPESRGITKFTDIRLAEYYRKFGVDLIYMDYSGFYLINPGRHGYSTGDPEAKRSDMHLRIVSITGFYLFSDDFSLRAAFMQNEKQNKWDWTLLTVVSAVYMTLGSDYPIIPQEDEKAFGDNAGFERGEFKGIAAGAGFGVTVPYNSYLFAVISYFGSGYMYRVYDTSEGMKTVHDGFYRINAKSSISYSRENYFYGLSFVFDSIANYSGIRILANTYTLEIFGGFRI